MPEVRLRHFLQDLRRAVGPKEGGFSDAALLDRFVRGRDETAFEGLIQRHGPMVLGVCRRVLRHDQDAEDAFQATFLALARKAGSIGRREALGGWLYQVAYRAALAARSRPVAWLALPADGLEAPDGGQEVHWRDLRPVLDEEINRLPDRYRAPFVLCYLQGRTNAEAARGLGCPEGTVLSRLAWARSRLRSRLVRRGLGPAAVATALAAGDGSAVASAQVPNGVFDSTIQAVRAFASGSAAAAGVPGRAALLAKGVVRAMWLNKVKTAAAVLAVAVGLACGAGVLVRGATAEEPTAGLSVGGLARVEEPVAPVDPEAEQNRGGGDDAVSVKNQPAVVVRTVPQAGDTQVDAAKTTEIRVTFSKDMADRAWSWSQISEETFPKTTGKIRYDQDRRTCILPVKLEPGKTYVLWLNPPKFQGFRDADGKPAVFYPLVFETKK